MRIVTVPKFDGWFSSFVFHGGAILLLCSFYLMWYNNISVEAFVQLMYGGEVAIKNNEWYIPIPHVVSGGKLPIGFGVVIGVVFSVIEIIFWTTNADVLKGQNENVKMMAKFALGSDVFTAFFSIMGGTGMFDDLWVDPAYFVGKFILSIIISVGFLSVGSEFILALAIESMRNNREEGMKTWSDLIWFVVGLFNTMFDRFSRGSNAPGSNSNNNQSQTKPQHSQQPQMSRREQLDRDPRLAFGGGGDKHDRSFEKPNSERPSFGGSPSRFDDRR